MSFTVEQLKKMSCASFAGSNCVLHQCMYYCAREKAIQEAKSKSNSSNNNIDNSSAEISTDNPYAGLL